MSTSRLYIVARLFNLDAEYIMRNAGLDEAQSGIKIAGKISITSDTQMVPPLWKKVKRQQQPTQQLLRAMISKPLNITSCHMTH